MGIPEDRVHSVLMACRITRDLQSIHVFFTQTGEDDFHINCERFIVAMEDYLSILTQATNYIVPD